MPARFRVVAVAVAVVSFASAAACGAASDDTVILASRPSGSTALAEGNSYHTTISGNGRFVTFMSSADNLVPGDDNQEYDIFVRDAVTQSTTLASRASGRSGRISNGRSSWPAISANGRYVAFQSFATNLVADDSNGSADVFVRDLRAHTTRLVTPGGNGNSFDPAISSDGRFVAFQSYATNLVRHDRNGRPDVFVRDLRTASTYLLSRASASVASGNGGSDNPSISAGGRFVAFESGASNLVRGDDNHAFDVFVADVRTRDVRLISRARSGPSVSGNAGSYMPSISADGDLVAFASRASNLVRGDGDQAEDVFAHSRRTRSTQMVSVGPRRRAAGTTQGRTIYPSVSEHGRFVAFHSDSAKIVARDENRVGDVFLRDLRTRSTMIVSGPTAPRDGGEPGYSGGPSLSADGRFVAFASAATNLVDGDTNRFVDVFRCRLR